MSCTHDVPDRGAQEGKVASADSGSEMAYALELEAQSKELRMLLSGLASRDTLAAPPALGGLDEAGAAAPMAVAGGGNGSGQPVGHRADGRVDGASTAYSYTYGEESSYESYSYDLGFFDNKRMAAPFTEASFALAPGELSEIVETQFGFHVIKVEEVQEAAEKPLSEVEAEIAADLAAGDRAPELAMAHAKTLLPVLRGELEQEQADSLLAERSLMIQDSGEFNLGAAALPKLGRAPEALAAVAGLSSVGDVTPEPVKIPTGYVVFKITELNNPVEADYAADSSTIRRRLLLTKETRAVEGYTAGLKESAKILIAPGS